MNNDRQPVKICAGGCEDKDGDTHYAISPDCPQGDDCNDNDASVYLDAQELCDGVDNNCDGQVDEGCCEVDVKVSPDEVAPQKTYGNTEADIVLTLKKPAPPDGCTVKLSVVPVENTGGHMHDGNRKNHTGSIALEVIFETGEPVGSVKHVKYTSGEVSGTEKIIAKLVGGSKEEFPIDIGVDGLVRLGGGYYSLKIQPSYNKHTDVYNVQTWVKSTFDTIAQLYHQRFPTAELLVVTDASLKLGGLYDYRNTWRPPHNTHRIGTDIDVRSWNIPKGNRKEFEKIVCQATGFPYLEYEGQGDEHYHLFFYPYKGSEFKYCEPYRRR